MQNTTIRPYIRYIISYVLSFKKLQILAETPRVSSHEYGTTNAVGGGMDPNASHEHVRGSSGQVW
jgi:hypothetical protein